MKPKKVFIRENEGIIAFHLSKVLSETAEYEARILKPSENISFLISNEKPEIFILSSDIYFKISEKVISVLRNFNIPLIVMSAGDDESLESSQLNNENIFKVIEKPFDENEFIDCMHECLDQREKFNVMAG